MKVQMTHIHLKHIDYQLNIDMNQIYYAQTFVVANDLANNIWYFVNSALGPMRVAVIRHQSSWPAAPSV